MNQQLAKLIKKDYQQNFAKKKFIPGKTLIPASGKSFGPEEMIAMTEAVLEGWWTEGHYAEEFEKKFAQWLARKFCLTTASGSSAILIALTTLTSFRLKNRRLKPGDEVITIAAGFPTTVNPIIINKLIPVFVDVDLETLNININQLQKAISKKTKAIFLPHNIGNPFNLKEVTKLCRKYNLWLIEDCCDALGSRYQGKLVGSFGHLAAFSFYAGHHMTMGEGGAIVTNDKLLNRIARSVRDWGRDCFIAGTPITLNGKTKNIEDIIVGDIVLTHDAKFLPVTHTFKKIYKGKIYKIKAHLIPPFEMTSDHRFLVLKNSKTETEWVRAEDINKKGMLLEAVPKYTKRAAIFNWAYKTAYKKVKCSLNPEKDLMRLIGYWLAEGSIAKGSKGQSGYKVSQKYYFHRVSFSLNRNEIHYVNDIKKLMLRYFGVKGQTKREGGGIASNFKTRSGYEFFKKFFKTGASNKTLWKNMEYWDLNLMNSLLKGFWRGDGSKDFQRFSIASVSSDLIEKIRIILIRNHILPYYEIRTVNKHKASVVNGKIIEAKHNLYNLVCYGINGEKFANIIDEKYISRSKRQQAFFKIINGIEYICYPIHKISYKTVRDIAIYNIEVKGSHSYHAGRVAAHNCWCKTGHDNTCGKRFEWKLGDLPAGYDHKFIFSEIGYSLRITDIQAALGLTQFKKLNSFTKQRKENFQYLIKQFKKFEKYFILPQAESKSQPSWFGFYLTLKPNCPFSRFELIKYLESRQILTRLILAGNLIKQPYFKNYQIKYRQVGDLKNTNYVMNNSFWVGLYHALGKKQLKYIVQTFNQFLKRYAD